jgi:hypothetical protein
MRTSFLHGVVLLGFLFTCPVFGQESWKGVKPNSKSVLRPYVKEQLTRLFDGKFAELEKEAALPSYSNGGTIGKESEQIFFGCFAYSEWNDKPEWERFFKAMDAWDQAYPDSPYSRIARTDALIDHAWEARGSGFANTVTEEGWKLHGERLAQAYKTHQLAGKLGGTKHKAYWLNYLTLCRALQASPEKTLEVAEAGLKEFPTETTLYSAYCNTLLPRWGGEPGEWQKWLHAQQKDAKWPGGEMDPESYAMILSKMFKLIRNSDGPFFADPNLSWEKAKQGLIRIMDKHPDSIYWKTITATLAWAAGDTDMSAKTLATMKGQFDAWAISYNTFGEVTGTTIK